MAEHVHCPLEFVNADSTPLRGLLFLAAFVSALISRGIVLNNE